MAISQRQIAEQRLQQRLDLQLLATNRLLQMPVLELEQCIVQELADNPALESVEEQACPGCPTPGRQCGQCRWAGWEVAGRAGGVGGESTGGPWDGEPVDPLEFVEAQQTLHEYLEGQIEVRVEPEDRHAIRHLIAHLDDNGYLRTEPDELRQALGLSPAGVERLVRILQSLEPPGVGARSLRECLLNQARALVPDGEQCTLAVRILEEQWRCLAQGRLREAARGLRCDVAAVEAAVRWMKSALDPYPGASFRPTSRSALRSLAAVRPDIAVSLRDDGSLQVDLAPDAGSELRVSPFYARWLSRVASPVSSTEEQLRAHVREYAVRAQRFLRALDDRRAILRRVAECCIVEQETFFRSERDTDLVPLTRAQVAGYLRVHESTVSRAVADKHIRLVSGQVIPFTRVFDRSLCLRSLIRDMVAAEDPTAPLSDQAISDRLRRAGLNVARRTVMKYREEMNILSSRHRAQLHSRRRAAV